MRIFGEFLIFFNNNNNNNNNDNDNDNDNDKNNNNNTICHMACVCRQYNARSDWLIVTEF